MKPRFIVVIAIILVSAGYLGFLGFQQGQTYYHFCDEVAAMGAEAVNLPMKMHGRVVEGSVERDGALLRSFDLEYEGARFTVNYVGTEPVPDTFKDGIEAVVDGQLNAEGVFEGVQIQAKCASKYEAEYEVDSSGSGNTAR
jgi:cytochrome c-type biogenesis protein CcmE